MAKMRPRHGPMRLSSHVFTCASTFPSLICLSFCLIGPHVISLLGTWPDGSQAIFWMRSVILFKQKKKNRLNMFLVPIKLGPFKFRVYLILIIHLVPKKNSALSISPYSIQICLIYD